jgi:hypothetical protein
MLGAEISRKERRREQQIREEQVNNIARHCEILRVNGTGLTMPKIPVSSKKICMVNELCARICPESSQERRADFP